MSEQVSNVENISDAEVYEKTEYGKTYSKKNKFLASLTYVSLLILGVVLGLLGAIFLSGENFFERKSNEIYVNDTINYPATEPSGSGERGEVLLTMQGASVVLQEADTVVISGSITSTGKFAANALWKADSAIALVQAYLENKHQTEVRIININVTPLTEDTSVFKKDTAEPAVSIVPSEEIDIITGEPNVSAEDSADSESSAEGSSTEDNPYGYSARQDFSIEIPQEKAQAVVNELLEVSSLVEVNYISQKVTETDGLQSEALESATRDAENKALKYAEMLNMEIVGVRSVKEAPYSNGITAAAREVSSDTYSPSMIEISYNVEIVFIAKNLD